MVFSGQFKQRLFMSLLGFSLIFLAIYYSHVLFFQPFFVLINAAIIVTALLEYYHMAKIKGSFPLTVLGSIGTIFYLFAIYLSTISSSFTFFPPIILLLFLILSFLSFFNLRPSPIINLATTLFGILYLTVPLACAVSINYFHFPSGEDSRLWLAYVLIITKITDVGAYFCGKIMGKTKLAPHISPKKTVEGAIGGLIAAFVVSVIFGLYSIISGSPLFRLTFWQSIWLGPLLSIAAQFGDLAESILKRDAGIKDSSRLPGLGGILDVVDSLVFTLPLMYLILQMNILG